MNKLKNKSKSNNKEKKSNNKEKKKNKNSNHKNNSKRNKNRKKRKSLLKTKKMLSKTHPKMIKIKTIAWILKKTKAETPNQYQIRKRTKRTTNQKENQKENKSHLTHRLHLLETQVFLNPKRKPSWKFKTVKEYLLSIVKLKMMRPKDIIYVKNFWKSPNSKFPVIQSLIIPHRSSSWLRTMMMTLMCWWWMGSFGLTNFFMQFQKAFQ